MLSIQQLSHTYPNGVHALRGIDLEIPKGLFGLLGPNGAGKSSLMRTLATLQQPSTGRVRLGDIDVLTEPDRVRRTLGYLPQDFDVYPRGSAENLLDHLAVLKGISDWRQRRVLVDALLVQTNLHEVRSKHVSTFSGGMRQRFGIAQALIGRPSLIIVDEPTAGLDPEERNRFLNLLAEIGEDVVILLSTHIVDDVADLCPNMAVLANGEIVAKGTPTELVARLGGQVWQKTAQKGELETLKARYTVLSSHLKAGRAVVRVHAPACPAEGFTAVEANLEDVYFMNVGAQREQSAEQHRARKGARS
jgi:ABC-2 type transport system ATP-binding protein